MFNKEQVENLGWTYRPDTFAIERGLTLNHYWFTKDEHGMTISLKDSKVCITDDRYKTTFPNIVFNNIIDTEEELMALMRALKIAG